MKKLLLLLLLIPSITFSQSTGKVYSNFATSQTLPQSLVDSFSRVNINQTTASITMTVPAPTNKTTKVTEVWIANIGTASFTLVPGGSIDTATAVILKWTGADWYVIGKKSSSSGSFIPIAGNSGNPTTGNIYIGSSYNLNWPSGSNISDASGATTISSNTASIFSSGTGAYNFINNTTGNSTQFKFLATAARKDTFPDKSGTVAMTSDITTGLSSISAIAPITYNTLTKTIGIQLATGTTNGYLSMADWATFNAKEPAITSGTSLQYWRGDKTFQTLNTAVVPESGNLYFTNARSIGSLLTGYTSGSGTVSSSDNILQAIQKLNGNIGAVMSSQWTTSGSNIYYANPVIVGNSTVPVTTSFNTVETATTAQRGLSAYQFNSGTNSSEINFLKARGTPSAPTVITTADNISDLKSWAYDGTNFINCGSAKWTSIGTIATGIIPTTFSLSTANKAGVLSVAMTVDTAQNIQFSKLITGGTWNGTSIADAYISSSSNWNTAYTNRITSLTTTGSSGAGTLSGNILNIPNYTLAGLGGQTALVSGTSIKTVFGTSLLGSGDVGIATGTYGGTGVNNGSKTITLGGNLTMSGAFNTTFSIPQSTTYSFPNTASEILAGLGTTQTFTGQNTFSSSSGTQVYALQIYDISNTTYKTALTGTSNALTIGGGYTSAVLFGSSFATGSLFMSAASASIQGGNSQFQVTAGAVTSGSSNSGKLYLTSGSINGAGATGNASSVFIDVGPLTLGGTARNGIVLFGGSIEPTWNGLQRGMFIGNATAEPSSASTAGAYLWSFSNTLKTNANLKFSNSSAGIIGVTDGSSATSGNVGEYIVSTISTYTNFTTTATYQNVTSITLTAGDWDLSAFGTYSSASSTMTGASNAIFVIATATASATGSTEGLNVNYIPEGALVATSKDSWAINPYRVTISGSTTYYLNAQSTFTLGNPQYVGTIQARRIR